MSPGGGDSVPAGAAPIPPGALDAAGALDATGDVGPVAGELTELLHAAAQNPAAARTRICRVTTRFMAGRYSPAGKPRRCAR